MRRVRTGQWYESSVVATGSNGSKSGGLIDEPNDSLCIDASGRIGAFGASGNASDRLKNIALSLPCRKKEHLASAIDNWIGQRQPQRRFSGHFGGDDPALRLVERGRAGKK